MCMCMRVESCSRCETIDYCKLYIERRKLTSLF